MFSSSVNETGPFVPTGIVQEDLALPPPAPIEEDMEEDDEDVIMGTAAGAPTSPSPPVDIFFTVTVTVTVKYIFYHHDYSEKYFIEFTNLNTILSVNGPNIGSTNFNDESSHELVNNTNDIQFLPRKDRDQRCLSRSYRRYKKSFDLDLKFI